jgi:hypothetical protein
MKKRSCRLDSCAVFAAVNLLMLALPSAVFGQSSSDSAPTTNSLAKMPEVIVTGNQLMESRPGWLKEEQYVGPYNQPEWTTARRFAGTRVYLQQQPWGMGVEQWVRFRNYRDGSSDTRFQEEFEIGLPYRFQVDLYETWTVDQDWRSQQDEWSAEIRYALADWGKIPLNPTLYLEYSQHDHDPNALEGKLLLGTDLAPRWHWGLNLICERELSGAETTEYAVSQGLSYTLLDEKLGAGVEMKYAHVTASGSPDENEFLIGPSAQWRITDRMHLDITPMFGCTQDSPVVEAWLVFGFSFGGAKSEKEHYAPSSLMGQ